MTFPISSFFFFLSNDGFEGEPEEKRRKTANVVLDQPAAEHKVVIDNVPCSASPLEEVRAPKPTTYTLSSLALNISLAVSEDAGRVCLPDS